MIAYSLVIPLVIFGTIAGIYSITTLNFWLGAFILIYTYSSSYVLYVWIVYILSGNSLFR